MSKRDEKNTDEELRPLISKPDEEVAESTNVEIVIEEERVDSEDQSDTDGEKESLKKRDFAKIESGEDGKLSEEYRKIIEKEKEKKYMWANVFGIKPFKAPILREEKKEEKISDVTPKMVQKKWNLFKTNRGRLIYIGNVTYCILLGIPMALLYFGVSVLCFCSIICIEQGYLMFDLGKYFFWPFNKYIERDQSRKKKKGSKKEPLFRKKSKKERWKRWKEEISIGVFQLTFALFLGLNHLFYCVLCWFGIFTITISKLHFTGFKIIVMNPLRIRVKHEFPPSPGADIALCVFRALNCSYYKYTVLGMNIFLVNMFPIVLLTIIFGLFLGESFTEEFAFIIFPMALISTIPLAYYIGQAVSSISSQSSFAVGAFINAAFGSIIELILYIISLSKGLTDTVHKAVTGSLLGVMLLMPGLSMFFGGLRYSQQYFNRQAASVSAVLLFLAVTGAFLPTLFYEIYGSYRFSCDLCQKNNTKGFDCQGCYYYEKNYLDDPIFHSKAKPLNWLCAVILPIAYFLGLLFAFKTHKDLYEKPVTTDEGETQKAAGHGHTNWGKLQAFVVLIGSTLLFACVAEVISTSMKPGVEILGMSESFAGITLIGVIPNAAEYINAIQFSLENNIILSLEIGNVACLQIALVQTSFLIGFTQIVFGWILNMKESVFYLIFQRMDLFYVFFGVLILNYIMMDGKTNWFRGAILAIVYILIVFSYFVEYH